MGTHTPVTGYSSVTYASPTVPQHGVQRYCLYHPDSTRFSKPPNGWPCLITANLAGFKSTYLYTSLGPVQAALSWFEDLLVWALDNGMAVVNGAVLPTYSDDVAGCPPTVDADPVDLTLGAQQYGNAPYGNGTFIPFECATPSDYSGSLAYGHPMSDPLRNNGWRDAGMLFQHVWHNAAAMGLDRANLIDTGGSASADVLAYCSWGPNRAASFFPNAVAGTQDAAPTRVTRASIYLVWQPWFPLFAAPSPIPCFPRPTSAGGSTLYSNASTDVSDTTGLHLERGSFLHYARQSNIYADNLKKPLMTLFTDSDAAGSPFTTAKLAATTNPHSSWGGSAIINGTAFPSNATFYMGTNSANTQNDGVISTMDAAGDGLQDNGVFFQTLLAWLDSTVGVTRLPKRNKWAVIR